MNQIVYIKLDDDKNLVITVNEPIYRGENISQRIAFLLPKQLDEVDLLTAAVYMTYIRADGAADINLLKREEEEYNEEYFQYHLPITCTMTRYPGEVCLFLQIYSGTPSFPTIAKIGECMLQILASSCMDDHTPAERCILDEMYHNYKAQGWNGNMDAHLKKVYALRTDHVFDEA